jgi:cell division protein ZapA (FtsZ GTPase activity inhibitor)
MSDNTTQITVLIASRPYPLKIKAGDEAVIRRIVSEVNDTITLFQNTYSAKDRQDCVAMALLTYAVDLHKTQSKPSLNDTALNDRLYRLENLVTSALNDN